MPWVRIHDGALRNLKVQALSDNGFRLWVAGLAHCQEHLTDGEIRFEHLSLLSIRKVKQSSIDELCQSILGKSPLWVKTSDGYQVHDYFAWNDRAEDVIRKRAEKKARQDKWRASRDASRDASTGEFRDALRDATPHHTTTTPQVQKERTKHVRLTSDVPEGFVNFWATYPRKVGKAEAVKAWRQIKPVNGTVEAMAADIARRLESGDWRPDRVQFIPHASTYLRGRRWEDEPESLNRSAPSRPEPSAKAIEQAKDHIRKIGGCPHGVSHSFGECVRMLAASWQ